MPDDLEQIPGTLPISEIRLRGNARIPTPAIAVNFRTFDTGCGNHSACGVEVADTMLQQGQGIHGRLGRANTYNTIAAIGPDFKREFADAAPVSNADVAQMLTKVLNLRLSNRGRLIGRVIEEALTNGPSSVASRSQTIQSAAPGNGLRTMLKFQSVGQTLYLDAAGFPGRTVGL